jgi:predicted nucleic acid-binding protein
MVAPGECWTLSSSECPSDAVASSLSDILETGAVPRRYFLSAKACAGILRRAAKRGKKLPDLLAAALASVAGATISTVPERSCP